MKTAYILLRKDVMNDGDSYDNDYPIEAAFVSRESAEWYLASLLNDMRETDEYDDYLDDELFEIVEVPLMTAFGEEDKT